MNDILTEVDDAIRRERMERLWQQWGRFFIAALVAIIVITAVSAGFRSWNLTQNQTETSRLFAAFDAENPLPDLDAMAQDTRGGHKAFALLAASARESALVSLEQGDDLVARARMQDLYNDNAIPDIFRDYARLSDVNLAMQDENWAADYATLIKTLEPLLTAIDGDHPFAAQAHVTRALIAAHGEKNYALANEYLSPVRQASLVSTGLKERAHALSMLYMAEQEAAE